MKSDHATMPKSKETKNVSANNSGKNKNKVTFSDVTANAVEKAKPRSGRGLANEGTIVSYDEAR